MKIDSGIPTSSPVNPTAPAPTRTGGPARSSGATSASDSVDITRMSAQLQELEAMLKDMPVVDSAQVKAIKDAISDGRFNVDSDVVADRLLSSVKELLLQRRPA
ncbi:MAG: flagellar biosynthesis anti-sigma factor FlgM [Proteobacteria bacterium]|nr:flagellar biosynthesis anti-sigma factor FlgM [Burkholderiales bacterium]